MDITSRGVRVCYLISFSTVRCSIPHPAPRYPTKSIPLCSTNFQQKVQPLFVRHAILSSDSDFQSELLRQANDFFDLTLYKRITFMKQFNAIIIIVPKIFNVCFTAIGTFAENCKNPGNIVIFWPYPPPPADFPAVFLSYL